MSNKAPLVLGLLAVMLIVAAVFSSSSPVELAPEDSYGAYSANIATTNPTSLGFSPYEYLNSQQSRQAPRQQQARPMSLAEQDEALMQDREAQTAAKATEAIRKDMEQARLNAIRRHAAARNRDRNSYHHHHLAARGAEHAEGSLYNPAAQRRAFMKHLAQQRLATNRELHKTFVALARAVGSDDDDSENGNNGRFLQQRRFVGSRDSSMLSMSNDENNELPPGVDPSEVPRNIRNPQRAYTNKHRSSSNHPNNIDVHDMANEDFGHELDDVKGEQDYPVYGDNAYSSDEQDARLMPASNAESLAQMHGTRRSQSLAALARENGNDLGDMAPQWNSFTQQLGMSPNRPNVDRRAVEQVDELINNDRV